MGEPKHAKCHKDYFPARNQGGTRPLSAITAVVWHNAVSDDYTAEAIARWFRDGEQAGSTQLIVDSEQCQRSVSDGRVCYGAAGANVNYWGVHMEFCSQVWWSPKTWFRKHRRMMRRGAYKTAQYCFKYHIRPRFLSANDLRKGERNGITSHKAISKAFVPGGHTDAGPPRIRTMRLVKKYLAAIRERQGKQWA